MTPALRERFCKDNNIPIKVFEAPYFMDRLLTLSLYYKDLEDKYKRFCEAVSKYKNPEEYFAKYTLLKEKVMEHIRNSEGFKRFMNEDMKKFSVPKELANLPCTSIYKETNVGKKFVSIDMKKANFSTLYWYDKSIFMGTNNYEDFISKFTDDKNFIESKYIRQVIFGNLSPKRQTTYEKFIMSIFLGAILEVVDIKDIYLFQNDEIVFEQNNYSLDIIKEKIASTGIDIPLVFEEFTLHKFSGIKDAYLKQRKDDFVLKGVNSLYMPFVIKYLYNKPVSSYDSVFVYEGRYCQLLEIPIISLN